MWRLASLSGRHRSAGVSLLETLIALLLLSVGVLSMAAVQAAAVKYTKLAQYKGLATQYSNEIADRMRANVD
ncbi:MAG: type IV pilus modification protein PilV, partial [Pseudomonadota bacterium]|nr:type IV pilus modification protein PilV [Pseudomonadota bacterium]